MRLYSPPVAIDDFSRRPTIPTPGERPKRATRALVRNSHGGRKTYRRTVIAFSSPE